MYPFLTSSVRNFCSALSSSCVWGYTLQSIASGASLLNTLAKLLYSSSTLALVVYCCTCMASSVAIVCTIHCNLRVCTISSFSLSVCTMIDSQGIWGFTDLRTIGNIVLSMVACFQLNFGL